MERSIDPHEVLWLDRSSTGMDPIRAYLADGTLPKDSKEADRVKRQANWFILYDGILYKRSFAQPLLHCITPKMGKRISEELHEGVCNSHIGDVLLQSWQYEPDTTSQACGKIL